MATMPLALTLGAGVAQQEHAEEILDATFKQPEA
jgi:hypothetical protein